MPDEQHGDKAHAHEKRGIGEQDLIADVPHQRARQHRGDDLGHHGCGVIISGKLAHVRPFAHLHHHGQGVDVDGCPGQPHQGKGHIHGRCDGVGIAGHQKARDKAGRQKDDPRLNRALPAKSGGHHADGNIGHDGAHRSHHKAGIGTADALSHHRGDIAGEPRGHAVIPRVPQRDGGQQKDQAFLHRLGQHLAAASVVLGKVPLRMLLLHLPVLLHQLGLPDGEQQYHHRQHHNAGHDEEQRLVVNMDQAPGLFCGVEQHTDTQIEHTAHRAHQVDDGVTLGAQRLRGHVRHERHGGRTIGTHGNQQQAQHNDEGD